VVVFVSVEDGGEESIRFTNRDAGLESGASSSSSLAEEDGGRAFRFRRLAGGAIPAEARRSASTSVCLHREDQRCCIGHPLRVAVDFDAGWAL